MHPVYQREMLALAKKIDTDPTFRIVIDLCEEAYFLLEEYLHPDYERTSQMNSKEQVYLLLLVLAAEKGVHNA